MVGRHMLPEQKRPWKAFLGSPAWLYSCQSCTEGNTQVSVPLMQSRTARARCPASCPMPCPQRLSRGPEIGLEPCRSGRLALGYVRCRASFRAFLEGKNKWLSREAPSYRLSLISIGAVFDGRPDGKQKKKPCTLEGGQWVTMRCGRRGADQPPPGFWAKVGRWRHRMASYIQEVPYMHLSASYNAINNM